MKKILLTLMVFGSFGVIGDDVFLLCVPMGQADQNNYISKHLVKFENPQEEKITKGKVYRLDIDLPEKKFSVIGPWTYLVRQSPAWSYRLQFHLVNNDFKMDAPEEWDLRFLDKTTLRLSDPPRRNQLVDPHYICSKINRKIFDDELNSYLQNEELQNSVEKETYQIK